MIEPVARSTIRVKGALAPDAGPFLATIPGDSAHWIRELADA